MALNEYKQIIQVRFNYVRDKFSFQYEEDFALNVSNEIIAYLLTKAFDYRDGFEFGFNNLNNYYNNKIQKNIKDEIKDKYYDKDFRKLQRREQKIRMISENHQKYLIEKGFDASAASYMDSEQKGRFYDLAKLEFISQRRRIEKKIDLFDLTVNNMICDSKKVPDSTLIEAYDVLDSQYEKARSTKDKTDYIFKWINFYRMETAMRYSLIYKIADYLSKNKPSSDFMFSRLKDVWGTRYFDDGYISEAFQILRHEKFIEPFFNANTEEELSVIVKQAEKERILESILVRYMEEESKEYFIGFRKGNEASIEEVYDFCRNDYPIIENYTPTNFYLNYEMEKLNRSKIKHLRKVLNLFLSPEELKKICLPSKKS